MSSQQDNLNYLAELTETSTPSFFNKLSEENLKELRIYVDTVVNKDEAGLDKLFESMSMMMKFIPNFILHSITPKYIEPSIAARITNKLTVKQALGVTSGLPIEYIGDTAAYLDSRHAANILSGLKKNTIEIVAEYVINKHPLKALDIFEHVTVNILQVAKPYIESVSFDEESLSTARREILCNIQKLHNS
jgi:hypothetical protein